MLGEGVQAAVGKRHSAVAATSLGGQLAELTFDTLNAFVDAQGAGREVDV